MKDIESLLAQDREGVSGAVRELFMRDVKNVADEYFDAEDASLEITRTDGGFLVCILFNAHRVKSVKKPQ